MKKQYKHLGYNKGLKGLARKLRKDSTPAEIRLWSELLRGGKMKGYTFLRQRPVLNYIADFMCKELKLIIEVDGYSHNFERQWYKDQSRQKELEDKSFTVMRFWDKEIFNDIENVYRVIEQWIEEHENPKM
ncbi:MAG TPA: endonuclease domain-containing protein [Balneolaceae bacterium]|nr:endonuclease domain-containing protein [Balneolaceae bacterium]